MSVWFQGNRDIDCDIGRVQRALDDHSELFVAIVGRMPGMTSVELVEQGSDSVIIRTNEGLMKRTAISKQSEDQRVLVEFDEEYAAGSRVRATAHFFEEFTASHVGVTYRLVMSNVKAPGLLGFLYRRFGSSNTGNAFLGAYKAHFEGPTH